MGQVLSIWLFIVGTLVIAGIAVTPSVVVMIAASNHQSRSVRCAALGFTVVVLVPLGTFGLMWGSVGLLAPALGIPQ